jgi:uncharacterized protein (TIGR00255 family)
MIKSMTGFGKHNVEVKNNVITIEIRALNSKQLDLNLRSPINYKENELEARNLVSSLLQRGKIDVNINIEHKSAENAPVINAELAQHYYSELNLLSRKLGVNAPSNYLELILKMPDVLATQQEEIDPEEWQLILDGLGSACKSVDNFRTQEGKLIETEFISRIKTINGLLLKVEPFEVERSAKVKERIQTNLSSLTLDNQPDRDRLEQEMIYYIEKLDISEEKSRLKKHCDYFIETLRDKDAQGKKLGFISQEIGREINTMGAKANDVNIQKIVVLMKDELEKVKEQLFNIL